MKNKVIIYLAIFIVFYFTKILTFAKSPTVITADDGIEVFQIEKYYNVSKNVDLKSEDFDLKADNLKAYYDKDFYDLIKIIATGDVVIKTNEGSIIRGEKVIYEIPDQKFDIMGSGNFVNESLTIIGEKIIGSFFKVNDETVVKNVEAEDPQTVFIQNKEMKSYSKSAIYSKENEVLELFDNVKIIKGQEITTGDYANINILTNNYTIKSVDNKVQLLINSED